MQQSYLTKTLSTKSGEKRSRNPFCSFSKQLHVSKTVIHEIIRSFRAVLQTCPHDRSSDSTWLCFDLRGRSINGRTTSSVSSRRQHYANLFNIKSSLPSRGRSERPNRRLQHTSDEVSATPQRRNRISGKTYQGFQKDTLVRSEMNA